MQTQQRVIDLTQSWRNSRLSLIGQRAAEQNLLNDFEREEKLRTYRRLLADADWHYEMNDDAAGWRVGARHFDALYELQAEVDADGAIWRSVAPQGFGIPQPRVKGGAA